MSKIIIITDPPYGMGLDTDYSSLKSNLKFFTEKGLKHGNKYSPVIGDDKPFDASFLIDKADEIFLFGADYYIDTLPNYGKDGSWLVWDKRVEENMDRMFGSSFETIWSKNKHKREIIRVRWAGIFGSEKEQGSHRVHPTQKPIELLTWIIKKYTNERDIILDLFGGSGSTLIACEQTNRICYMMELDPKYCDVIRKRYSKFIGKESEWIKETPVM